MATDHLLQQRLPFLQRHGPHVLVVREHQIERDKDWRASTERALRVARRVRTGTMDVNGASWWATDTPFGGMKQSGLGRENGVTGFEEYLDTRVISHPAG